MEHPNYDQWWQERDSRRSCYNIDPAVLIVGGLFDAEDCYGAWELYKAIRKQSPQTDLEIIMGPWHHGAWNGKGQSNLGNIDFGSQTGRCVVMHDAPSFLFITDINRFIFFKLR